MRSHHAFDRRYGCKPDRIDARDRRLLLPQRAVIPNFTDLRPHMPPIYDQGPLGSCTAQGTARIMDYERAIQGLPFLFPSRLGIYYDERSLEGSISEDAGAEIRDGIKVLGKTGAAPESIWPYDPNKFSIHPPPQYYTEAIRHQALAYQRVPQSSYGIRYTLGVLRRPVIFGCLVFDEFESDTVAKTGDVPMPPTPLNPRKALGGHCMVICGHDDLSQKFLVANSWGEAWGVKGYCYFPYDYILNTILTNDLWVVTREEEE